MFRFFLQFLELCWSVWEVSLRIVIVVKFTPQGAVGVRRDWGDKVGRVSWRRGWGMTMRTRGGGVAPV